MYLLKIAQPLKNANIYYSKYEANQELGFLWICLSLIALSIYKLVCWD